MAETKQKFSCVSSLSHAIDVGHFGGERSGDYGVTLCVPASPSCILISAQKGQKLTLTKLLKKHYGIDLPAAKLSEKSKGFSLRWFGPDQWLLIAEPQNSTKLITDAKERLLAAACVCDQSHGRTTIIISGPQAKALLEKGMPVDLHESNFNIGCCAVTDIAHIAVHICQTKPQEYEISCNRSFSESLWHWLCEMSLEFGYKVA